MPKLRSVRTTIIAAAALVGLVPLPASAARLARGNSVLWVGVHGDRAQLVPDTTFNAGFFEYGEVGVNAAISHFVTDHWTVLLEGDFSGSSFTFDATGGGESKSTSTSWAIRFGGDRYAFINDDVALYAGPGIRFWQGKVKDDGIEGPDVKQIALNGRLGMWTRLGAHYGLYGHIGQVIGYNTADRADGRVKWWSSHHEGSVGLAFDF